MNSASSLQNFFKENGITGNAIVDSLILAHLIPIVISYIGVLSGAVIKVISFFWQLVITYIQHYTRNKIMGKTLCTVILDDTNALYQFLKNNVFDKKIESDKIAESIFLNAINCIKSSVNENSTTFYKNYKNKYKNTIDLDIDYTADEDILQFKTRTRYYYKSSNVDKKYFKYEDYIIMISYKYSGTSDHQNNGQLPTTSVDNKNIIKIKLIYFGIDKNKLDTSNKKKLSKIIETFLNIRFKFNDDINYTYTVYLQGTSLSNKLANFISLGMINNSTGLLKYGDINQYNEEQYEKKYASTTMIMNMFESNLISDKFKYNEFIDLQPICENNFRNDDFFQLAKKYCIIPNRNNVMSYGYYMKNGKIYMLYKIHTWVVTIISPKHLLTYQDIKNELCDLIQMTVSASNRKNNKTNTKELRKIFKRQQNEWISYILDKRSFQTIYLPRQLMADVRNEIDDFIKKEKLYKEYEIPYKKGILLYGPPGTGKTSLVKSLAFEYQMDIYVININDSEINDDSIVDILNSIGGNDKKILLFEDVDSAFADKEKILIEEKLSEDKAPRISHEEIHKTFAKNNSENNEKSDGDPKNKKKSDIKHTKYERSNEIDKSMDKTRKYLTYSGLLNALDGVMSNQHGVITIMTTNHIEKLGDAFLRPGRIDKKFMLDTCVDEQIDQMVRTFVNKYIKMSMDDEEFKQSDYVKSPEEFNRNLMEFIGKLVNAEGQSNLKPCQLQFYILKHIANLDDLFNNYEDLL